MEKSIQLETLNAFGKGTLAEALGIEITDFGSDFVSGKMPVDQRTIQPFGLLHGGSSAALAETLGSIAGGMALKDDGKTVVGVEINCNHLRSAKNGWVRGKATPIKIGKRIQVWNIDIHNDNREMVATSRLTLAVINKK